MKRYRAHYHAHMIATAEDGPEALQRRCEALLSWESPHIEDASLYAHRCVLNVIAGDLWTASSFYREARALVNAARVRPHQRGLAITWIDEVWTFAQQEHARQRHDEAEMAVFLSAVEDQLMPLLDDDHLAINVFGAYLRRARRVSDRIRRRHTMFTMGIEP